MKIFDCFMYFDEDLILDLRLNYLSRFVDYFVIIESVYNHNGQKRTPKFDITKFKKFENKIKYYLIDHEGEIISSIEKNDSAKQIADKQIMNALKRENYQRNYILNGLKEANDEDWIIISVLYEIPNLEINDLKKKNSNIKIWEKKDIIANDIYLNFETAVSNEGFKYFLNKLYNYGFVVVQN